MIINARYTGGGGWKYNNNGLASYTAQQSGTWVFGNSPSGTADNVATFTTRIHIASDGKVGINETSPDNLLHVRSDNTPAAKIGGEGGSAYYMEIGQLTTSSSPAI